MFGLKAPASNLAERFETTDSGIEGGRDPADIA